MLLFRLYLEFCWLFMGFFPFEMISLMGISFEEPVWSHTYQARSENAHTHTDTQTFKPRAFSDFDEIP